MCLCVEEVEAVHNEKMEAMIVAVWWVEVPVAIKDAAVLFAGVPSLEGRKTWRQSQVEETRQSDFMYPKARHKIDFCLVVEKERKGHLD
jgi:hypothetical protein